MRRSFFGLEDFDQVAGRVNHPDLGATGSAHHVITPKLHPGGAKPRCLRFDIRNTQLNAIPPAGHRFGAVRHRSPTGTFLTAEQQSEVATADRSECRSGSLIEGKAQVVGVKCNGGIHIINHVPDENCR